MSRSSDRLKRVRRVWTVVALVVFNTLVLFAGLNLACWLAFLVKDNLWAPPPTNPVRQRYPGISLRPVYPNLTDAEIDALLSETWSRSHSYEPFTQHKERPYEGRYVNVAPHGYRVSDPDAPWPPPKENVTVFLFGGSTAFGMGLPDNQTIGSCLERQLSESLDRKVHLYNFGRGYYYSSQERALFTKLLAEGNVPDVAAFFDGLNDFILAEPAYTARLMKVMDGETEVPEILGQLPLVRAARAAGNWMSVRPGAPPNVRAPATEERVARVIDRYLINKKMIKALGEEFGVKTIFIWQPVPTYKYDIAYHRFTSNSPWRDGSGERTRRGYEYFAELLREGDPDPHFLWLADIQEDLRESLYVDQVHYTGAMSRLIAERTRELLSERGLLRSLRRRQ